MTPKEIVLPGVDYVRSRDPARVVHLAPDCISQGSAEHRNRRPSAWLKTDFLVKPSVRADLPSR